MAGIVLKQDPRRNRELETMPDIQGTAASRHSPDARDASIQAVEH
jgi:hypothetical protein